jgi:hypothetical protein
MRTARRDGRGHDQPWRTEEILMRTMTPFTTLAAVALVLAACGGDDAATDRTTGTTTGGPATTATPASPASADAAPEQTTAPTVPPTTSNDERWRELVDEWCAHWRPVATLPAPASDRASLEAFVQAHVDAYESTDIGAIELPPGPGRNPADLEAAMVSAREPLDRAAAGAAAGDFETTLNEMEVFLPHLGYAASAFAAAGQSCGPADADRAANAALNVSILGPWQVEVGYDSVWVSQSRSDNVVRIDSDSGEVVATIEMPSRAVKLQPADGRMLVRTEDSYVAVDAATNVIVGSLAKADVGPNANRSWAVDGALWICDGQRLHRYDPTTLEPVAVVELDIECGQVHATSGVAIAWTYNEEPGESGASRAAFVDPLTNAVVGSVELGGDAGVPIVLDDTVFFPPALGSKATVVDRSTWTVTATPDLGRFIDGGSQGAFDGESIYVIADKPTGTIAVIDPATFEVTSELMALATAPSLNSLAATPGVLWAVNNSGGILQRFDASALFMESFDDDSNGWGIIDDPDYGSADYAGGDYVWNLTGSSGHLLPETLGVQYDSGELDMRNVVVRADATIQSGDGVIGVFCREVPDTDADWQWYEFVARDGFAAIRRADVEGNLDVLAETDEVSLPTGAPITFEALCIDDADGNAQLSMSVNGSPLLTATDDEPLGNGVPGIQAWTFPVHEPIAIRWHDFSVHRPET